MNTSILQKCLDELAKETPKLDYVRGMLETLIEIWTVPYAPTNDIELVKNQPQIPKPISTNQDPEAKMLEAPLANINKIRQVAQESGAEL